MLTLQGTRKTVDHAVARDQRRTVGVRFCSTPADFTAWDDFVWAHEGAHYYQLYGWLRSYRPLGMEVAVAVAYNGDRLVGGAAFGWFRVPGLSSRRIYVIPHGPLTEHGDVETWHAIMRYLDEYFRGTGALYVQVWPHARPTDEDVLQRYESCQYREGTLFHSHRFSSTVLAIDLAKLTEDEIVAGFRKNRRRGCRHARRGDLELRLGATEADFRASYELVGRVAETKGYQPRPYGSLKMAFEYLEPRGRALLLQAWHQGHLVGTTLVLLAGRTVASYWGGSIQGPTKLYQEEFLVLETIRLGKERGALRCDLVNWTNAGVGDFKAGFCPTACEWGKPRAKLFQPFLAKTVSFVEKRCRPLIRHLAKWRLAATH